MGIYQQGPEGIYQLGSVKGNLSTANTKCSAKGNSTGINTAAQQL